MYRIPCKLITNFPLISQGFLKIMPIKTKQLSFLFLVIIPSSVFLSKYQITVETFSIFDDSMLTAETVYYPSNQFVVVKVKHVDNGNLYFLKNSCSSKLQIIQQKISSLNPNKVVISIVQNELKYQPLSDTTSKQITILGNFEFNSKDEDICYEGNFPKAQKHCWKEFKSKIECRDAGHVLTIDITSCNLN